jgi:hypothetical protein
MNKIPKENKEEVEETATNPNDVEEEDNKIVEPEITKTKSSKSSRSPSKISSQKLSENIFVIVFEGFSGDIKMKPLGKSMILGNANEFMTYVAIRIFLGRDWNPKIDKDPFYDSVIASSEPTGEYLRWMENIEIGELNNVDDIRGGTCVSGILHVGKLPSGTDLNRPIKFRYTVYILEPIIQDMMMAETDGDKELERLNELDAKTADANNVSNSEYDSVYLPDNMRTNIQHGQCPYQICFDDDEGITNKEY